jgi:CHAD domain-containing protein
VAAAQLEYLRPSNFQLKEIAPLLPAQLHASRELIRNGRRAFYDTFDNRLRSKGLRLVHEDALLQLVADDGRGLAAVPLEGAPEVIRPTELPPGPLRERLIPVSDVRVILRTAAIDSSRRLLPVLDDDEKTVARVVAERATLVGPEQDGGRLTPRVYLVGVRGYDKALAAVRQVLEDELHLTTAPETLEDELIARSGGAPPGAAADTGGELSADMRADRVAVALCTRLSHTILANLPGTLADLDSEFLHDLRVAVRRTRSLQRELKRVFPPDELNFFRQEFRWLQQVTGPSRDLDVYLLEFEQFAEEVPESQRPHLDLLRALLEEQRASEHARMEVALRSERTTVLLAEWQAFLERLPSLPVDDRPKAAMPIGGLAAGRIDRVYRQMIKMGKPIDASSPPTALHDLRKKGKELRYLLEFFSPLFPAKVTKPMVKRLKALQDTLGRFQDREVQAKTLRELGADLAGRPGGADTLMAIGVLVERLEDHQRAARAEFEERFAAFSAPEQRALVKKTFR